MNADGTITFKSTDPTFSGEYVLYYTVEDEHEETSVHGAPGGQGEPEDGRVTVTVVKLSLEEVTFGGPKLHRITSDGGTTVYGASHWLDRNLDGAIDPALAEHQYPVSYTRGAAVEVSARWQLSHPFGGELRFRADGPGAVDFPETVGASAGTMAGVDNVTSTGGLDDRAGVHEPFQIVWDVSSDGGMTWVAAGTSSNVLYRTLGDPRIGTLYHTVVDIGSRRTAGHDGSDVQASVEAIWGEFADLNVKRVDPTLPPRQLTYYERYDCVATSTAEMLRTGDGQCGAWTDFMTDVLRGQGIRGWEHVLIEAAPPWAGFLVQKWNFLPGAGSSPFVDAPYRNVPDLTAGIASWIVPGSAAYAWRSAEVTDATGIEGQGNPNPASWFNNHQLVKFGARYYDPSYAKVFASVQEVQDGAVAGFFVGYTEDETALGSDVNMDGDTADPFVRAFAVHKNAAGAPLQLVVRAVLDNDA